MNRASRLLGAALALIALAVSAGAVDATGVTASYTLTVPSSAQIETTTAIQLNLPLGVAAVNGRVYFNSKALEFVGVAPLGAGSALSPVAIKGGVAFAAYGLKPVRGSNAIRLVVVPDVAGRIQLNVVIDAAASASGARLSYVQPAQSVALQSGTSTTGFITPAPAPGAGAAPTRAATATRTLVGQRVLTLRDLDTVTAAWQDAMANGTACGAASAAADANGDGCVDAVDIQAVSAGIGQAAAPNAAVPMVAAAAQLTSAQALAQAASPSSTSGALKTAVAFSHTFTVTDAGDTADANPGDGSCADSQGHCTLRAAMTESNWSNGSRSDQLQYPRPRTGQDHDRERSSVPERHDRRHDHRRLFRAGQPGQHGAVRLEHDSRHRHQGHGRPPRDEHLPHHQFGQCRPRLRALWRLPHHRTLRAPAPRATRSSATGWA